MPEYKPLYGEEHIPVVAFDLDGTLNFEDENPMISRIPNTFMKELMLKYKKEGYVVIIYTSRDISRKFETERWLETHGYWLENTYDDIVYNKLKYDVLIDDCAVNPACMIGDPTLRPELHKKIMRPTLNCEDERGD